jgi:hypothetical protein
MRLKKKKLKNRVFRGFFFFTQEEDVFLLLRWVVGVEVVLKIRNRLPRILVYAYDIVGKVKSLQEQEATKQ